MICELDGKWLLTNHKVRGLEFPGGKCEKGETLEEAARREVYEETGAVLGDLNWIGEYKVTGQDGSSFLKMVYWGQAIRLEKTNTYFETKGPVLIEGDLLKERFRKEYSFIMKDEVIEECIKRIQMKKKQKNSGKLY